MSSTDSDALEKTLDEIVKSAEGLIDGPSTRREAASCALGDQMSDCELIESTGFVTLIVHTPGLRECDLGTSATETEIRVSGPGFEVSRPLPHRIVPTSLKTTFRNGVVSVRASSREASEHWGLDLTTGRVESLA